MLCNVSNHPIMKLSTNFSKNFFNPPNRSFNFAEREVSEVNSCSIFPFKTKQIK